VIRNINIPDDKYMFGLGQIGAKRIHASWARGRALFMASHIATSKGYLVDCLWVIYDYGSAVMLGAGSSKAEALAQARDRFRDRKSLVRHFIEGRAKLASLHARVQASIEEFEDYKKRYEHRPSVSPRRQRVFLQDDGQCHYCKVKLNLGGDWQMDHFISKANGGKDHLSNLVAACTPCNQRKKKMNGQEFKKLLAFEAEQGTPDRAPFFAHDVSANRDST
jgi:5-methylcytosine-specific restriction endonuclease McrA